MKEKIAAVGTMGFYTEGTEHTDNSMSSHNPSLLSCDVERRFSLFNRKKQQNFRKKRLVSVRKQKGKTNDVAKATIQQYCVYISKQLKMTPTCPRQPLKTRD